MLLSPPFHLTVGRRLHNHKKKINGFSRTLSELDVAKFPCITAAQTLPSHDNSQDKTRTVPHPQGVHFHVFCGS